MQTIKTIWTKCKEEHAPMIGTTNLLHDLSFMDEYLIYHDRLDRRFMLEKQSFAPIWNDEQTGDEDVTVDDFKHDAYNYIWSNRERYEHLYAVRSVEYNPIYNVEEHTKNTTEDEYGEQEGTSNSNGNVYAFDSVDHVNSADSGAHSTTEAHTDKHTTTIERAGNIGVTSTMDLLTQEERYWRAFDFYKIIFDDIVRELCTLYDPGVDVF